MQHEPSMSVVVDDPVFADQERVALAGFPAGYRGATRDAYALDLRQFVNWCTEHHLALFPCGEPTSSASPERSRTVVAPKQQSPGACVRWPGSTATPKRRACWRSRPRVHVRRARLDYESHAIGLDRNEVGALPVAAGLGPAIEHALISLLALNGLRVSEATGADIEALGLERGHRTLTVLRNGGKIVTIPLAPRTARAIDLTIGERTEGPNFTGPEGKRLDRHGAARIVRRVTRRAGITKPIGPHTLRHAFITAALDAGVPLGDVQEAASHADPGPPCATTAPECLSTATQP
jgi:integrase/recombinase XerD